MKTRKEQLEDELTPASSTPDPASAEKRDSGAAEAQERACQLEAVVRRLADWARVPADATPAGLHGLLMHLVPITEEAKRLCPP